MGKIIVFANQKGGVGKTTICHLIMRLFDPDNGSITLDGIDLKRFKLQWLRNQIALVSQDTFLFHTTVLDNIRFSNLNAGDGEIAVHAVIGEEAAQSDWAWNVLR